MSNPLLCIAKNSFRPLNRSIFGAARLFCLCVSFVRPFPYSRELQADPAIAMQVKFGFSHRGRSVTHARPSTCLNQITLRSGFARYAIAVADDSARKFSVKAPLYPDSFKSMKVDLKCLIYLAGSGVVTSLRPACYRLRVSLGDYKSDHLDGTRANERGSSDPRTSIFAGQLVFGRKPRQMAASGLN